MASPAPGDAADLKKTPLFDLHVRLGAKMVPFAGYAMPVNYPLGVLKEHLHTREKAGLFDVSHMGQGFLSSADHETTARALERSVPGDIVGLKPGAMRYTLLLGEDGGILDDLMVTRAGSAEHQGTLFLVVNASCKDNDFKVIAAALPDGVTLERAEDRALLALQGPKAAEVLSLFCPVAGELGFMTGTYTELLGCQAIITRSGYTGEDGYEISVPADNAVAVAEALLGEAEVEAIGLGARDSLRLEAGLCLYGNDIDDSITPIEADLVWAVAKRRRREGGFPGAERILAQLEKGPEDRFVGIKPEGRAPARAGTDIVDAEGRAIGRVTSGGFGPSVGGPIAMGYVKAAYAEPGTPIGLLVRGKSLPASVVAKPFVEKRYHRPAKNKAAKSKAAK